MAITKSYQETQTNKLTFIFRSKSNLLKYCIPLEPSNKLCVCNLPWFSISLNEKAKNLPFPLTFLYWHFSFITCWWVVTKFMNALTQKCFEKEMFWKNFLTLHEEIQKELCYTSFTWVLLHEKVARWAKKMWNSVVSLLLVVYCFILFSISFLVKLTYIDWSVSSSQSHNHLSFLLREFYYELKTFCEKVLF